MSPSCLEFAAIILGEQETCVAKFTHVSPRELLITLQLFADDGQTSSDRSIPLMSRTLPKDSKISRPKTRQKQKGHQAPIWDDEINILPRHAD
jgi:hypothetical protein